ncbi:MAG TPA: OmpA family protein [Lysobacter sp.]
MNAFIAGRLRQDVCLVAGEVVGWSASHRGRGSATVADVMEFRIGAIPIARMSTASDGNPSSITAALGTVDAPVPANGGWVDYSGQFSYSGATATVDLGFEAISAASGNNSIGNFLDNIQINLRPFVEFAQAAYSQNEASPTGNRPRLVVAGTVPVGGMTVPVTVTGGTATLGLDYTTASGTADVSVFIPAGVYDNASFPLPITMVNDGSGDPDETITFGTPSTAGNPSSPYNLASLESCGGAPIAATTSTISEDPDPLPRIQLTKALSANRLAVSDQFVLRITGINGQQITTTGAGSAVGNGTITVGPATAGSAYTLSEVMAGGSASPLSAYTSSISCTNTTPNSSTVLPNGSGTSFSLTVVAGDNISCVITNDVATAPAFIDVVKSVTSGQVYANVGDVATYSYVVTNTGPTAVNTLTVTDNRIATVSCPVTTLAIGASTTCNGSYTVTQADIDDVLVTNIATARAQNPTAQVAIDTDDAVINRAFPAMTADKATTATNYTSVGQVIPYTYAIANTGNVTINALTVSDNRIATVTCPVTTLAPGSSTTCTGNYVVTQADLDSGSVTNFMSATGTPTAGTLGPITDTVTLAATAAAPAMTLEKSSTTLAYATVGQVVPYSYLVTNTGNVTISALAVSDNRISTVTCPVTTLAPGVDTTCTGNYTITQADLDAGSVTNVATATGTAARGTLAPVNDTVTLDATATPAFTLDKSSTTSAYATAGQVVPYSYLVTNTGNVTINALTVSDDKIATVSCPATTLAPGTNTTCSGSYTITQADLDAGSVTNVATASGTPTQGTLAPVDDTVTIDATVSPEFTLDKGSTTSAYSAAGQVVPYSYRVTNTGNVTINALVVSDDRIATVTCPVTTLAPGANTTCTGNYTITQNDLDAGSVTNNATATGTPVSGTLAPADDTLTIPATTSQRLTLDKTVVSGNPYNAVGDVVSYEYAVTNTGNVTINGLIVSDDKIATVGCPVSTLAPGASTTCTGSYTITQSDLDAGSVINNASATGTPTSGTLTPATDSATVTATAAPALTLDKTAVAGNPFDAVGDVVHYEYLVTNTGNVTITALSMGDDRIATVSCPVTTLVPGANTTCSGSYTITQSDLDAGSVTNNASATGTPASGTLTPATDSVTVTATAAPLLTLDKSVVSGNPYDAVGDVVSYEYLVTNTGNVSITALTVGDDRIATVTCPVTTLASGASTTCSGSYTITQADLDAGLVTNNASATGTPASGTLVPATDSATATSVSTPAFTLDKTAVSGNPFDAVGDVVDYEYLVTNPSNVTIHTLVVTDDKIATVSCPATTLAPGASTICTGSYTVTQADLEAGSVTNNAVAIGTPASGTLVPGTDSATVNAVQSPSLTLDKTAVSGNPFDAVGDVVSYEYLIANTGNVSITLLSVHDDRIATVTCPLTTLAPGASTTCTATYTITQADLDAGSVTNNATATGMPPAGTALPPATDSVTVTATAAPGLTLDKTAVSGNPYDAVGDVVSYEYLVINTGNVTISALVVSDDRIDAVTCPATTLMPGDSTTCAANYNITQADLDAGSVTNNATATGTPTQGTLAPATDSATVSATAAPTLTLEKTVVSGNPYDAVGDVVSYEYLVTNTGNVSISALTITDDKIATVNCPLTTLAPEASTTCTGSYTITQADLDAGSVTNNASANGTPASGTLTPPTDSVTVNALASVSYGKTASTAGPVAVGDTITYTLSVTVSYAASTSAVTLTDTLGAGLTFGAVTNAGAYTCNAASPLVCTLPAGMAPGTYAVSYTATVDISASGTVENAVVGTSDPNDPSPPSCSGNCTISTPVAAPGVTYAKAASTAGPVAVGDTITYTLTTTVTNSQTTSAVTLTDLLGAGLTFAAVTDAGAYTFSTTSPLVATLPAGTIPGTYTATYTATVNDQATGSVTNTVTGTGDPNDPNPPSCAGDCSTSTSVTASAVTYAKAASTAGPVAVGDTIIYTLTTTVTNSQTTGVVTLTDTLGSGLTFGAVANAGAYTCNGVNPLVCTLPIGTVPGSYPVTYFATVDVSASGTVDNAVVGTGDPNDPNPPACTGTCSISTPVAAPVVTYAKTASTVGPVVVDDVITYTLTTTVANSQTTSAVALTDTLGAGLTFGAVTSAGAYACNATSPLVCTLPAGTAPGTYAMTYTATVNGSARGTVDNAVVGTADPNDPNPPSCAGDCSIATPVAAPVINVGKSSNPAGDTEVQVGQTIEYTLTVVVGNSATLADVVLTDTPDPGLTIGALPAGCVRSGATITCTLPAGSAVGVHTFVYSATVNEQVGATVGNAVTATSAGGSQLPPICGTCSTQHQVAASELRLVKTAAVREVRIGDLVRYTLTVENVGNGNLTNGSVVDTPPAGFSYVEGSLRVVDGDNQANVEGQSPLRFTGVDVAAGQTATLAYLMRVGAGVRPGTHRNQAQAFSPTTGEPISNVATAQVELVADPLLDDSLIFGTVFGDRDGDGWQDTAGLSEVRVQGGFAPGAYIANSTAVDRGAGPQPVPDASAPLLHGIDVGAIAARQSDADPADQVVIRQHLNALTFTDDFVLTSAEGVTVKMDAEGTITIEKQGEAAKGLNAAAPTVARRVAQGEGGYVVDYVIGNAGVDERGIPGVRIVSVEGLLIETDQYGRYHLVGMPGGPAERGRNFVLKVDPSTLPSGAEFTTDNPLLRRITPGLPVRFDWGIKLPAGLIEGGTEQVEMELGEVFFAPGSAEVRAQYQPVIEKMAAQVREHRGGEVVIDANGDTDGLAFDRAMAVKQALLAVLDADSATGLVISARGNVDDPDSLVVGVDEGGALLGTVLFDTGQAAIKPEFEPLLDKIAAALERMDGGAVAIVGHTDVRGSYDYNVALGMRRAKAVYDALAKRLSPQVRAKVRVEASNDPAAPVGTERNQGAQGS